MVEQATKPKTKTCDKCDKPDHLTADCPYYKKAREPEPKKGDIQYDKDNMKYIYICMNCYEAGNPTHIW